MFLGLLKTLMRLSSRKIVAKPITTSSSMSYQSHLQWEMAEWQSHCLPMGGTTVAIRAHYHDGMIVSNSGHVRVYRLEPRSPSPML